MLRKSILNRFISSRPIDVPIYINVWQRPDGEFYVRITKHKVHNTYLQNVNIGYVNSYGHKLIDSIKQYIDVKYIEK